ncbi:hypothetical protein ACFLT9_07380 [Acidobacteriota bacterium]
MKNWLMRAFCFVFVFSLLAFPANLATDIPGGEISTSESNPGKTADQEPDYMRKYLLRNTRPLGLNEDQILQRYLAQPSIKWAIRSSRRHILN